MEKPHKDIAANAADYIEHIFRSMFLDRSYSVSYNLSKVTIKTDENPPISGKDIEELSQISGIELQTKKVTTGKGKEKVDFILLEFKIKKYGYINRQNKNLRGRQNL